MTSYETLVGYELQNVPKFNSRIKNPSLDLKLISLHEQLILHKNDRVYDHVFFLTLD